jgi:hypothetical protein
VSEPGVKSALAAARDLIATSAADWTNALRRRVVLAGGLIVATVAIEAVLSPRGWLTGRLFWVDGIASTVLAFSLFADAMRMLVPSYRLTGTRILRLAWISVVTLFFLFIAAAPALYLRMVHQTEVAYWLFAIATIFVQTRLCFAWFAAERESNPYVYSWLLTSGATFLPSAVLVSLASLPRYALGEFLPKLPRGAVALPAALETSIPVLILAFVSGAWIYPMTARWLLACERMHPEVVPEEPADTASLPALR